MHGWDREAMTSDAGGGAYCGPVASAKLTSVTLAEEPKWGGRDWRGAGVFILDGKGMGQYRRIGRTDGRRVDLDEPWVILPDGTSTVTVTMLQRNYYFIYNEFEDAGIAIRALRHGHRLYHGGQRIGQDGRLPQLRDEL